MTSVAQGLVEIVKEHTPFRKSAHFVDLITILRKMFQKVLERKSRELARLMFLRTGIRNVHLGNAVDVDLKIT